MSTMLKGSKNICRKLARRRCNGKHRHSYVTGALAPNAEGIRGSVSSWAGGYTKEFSQAVLGAAEESLEQYRLKSVRIRRLRSAFPAEKEEGEIERDDEGRVIEEILMDELPTERARAGKERDSVPEEATMTTEEEIPDSLWSENEIPNAVREDILSKVPATNRRQVRKTHR